jgi:hypothetical protein
MNFRNPNRFLKKTQKVELLTMPLKSNPESIFERYSSNPVFTSNTWGGFQASLEHWKRLGSKTVLLSDEQYTSDFLNLFDQSLRSVKNLEPYEFESTTFFVRFTHDEEALAEIANVIKYGGRFVSSIESEKASYRFTNKKCFMAMQRTWSQKDSISHLFPIVHENLCEALEMTRDLDGDVLEIGVYKGGSALTILNYLDIQQEGDKSAPQRSYIGLDTFTGFDYDAAESSPDLIWYKTHELFGLNQTISEVQNLLNTCKTPSALFPIDICAENLPDKIIKLSVVNVDVDMYESTKIALQKVSPFVQLGGVIICEDVTSTPALYGASLAVKQFIESIEGKNYLAIHKLGQLFLYKIKS